MYTEIEDSFLKPPIVPLSRGRLSLVDTEDFDRVMQFKWSAEKSVHSFYAFRRVSKKSFISLHRLIMGIHDRHIFVDHKNGNGLDNRRENLRICTRLDNSRNRGKFIKGESIFKGVNIKYTKYPTYVSRIRVDKKLIHLGTFDTEIDAAITYNIAAKKFFGQFARLNPIPTEYQLRSPIINTQRKKLI